MKTLIIFFAITLSSCSIILKKTERKKHYSIILLILNVSFILMFCNCYINEYLSLKEVTSAPIEAFVLNGIWPLCISFIIIGANFLFKKGR